MRSIVIALSCWVVACAPPSPPKTSRAQDFAERLYHVYIVSNVPYAFGQGWTAAFHGRLSAALASEHVTQSTQYVHYSVQRDVELATVREREHLARHLDAFDPETVLVVLGARDLTEQTAWGTTERSLILMFLFTPDDESLVWAFAYGFRPDDSGGDVAEVVLDTMQREGLIRGGPPPATRGAKGAEEP